jgi:hypothetical protein
MKVGVTHSGLVDSLVGLKGLADAISKKISSRKVAQMTL